MTVPWSHLPFLLLALFVAQCIHEAGHALAAALYVYILGSMRYHLTWYTNRDAVSLHSVGASITAILPSAFVSLSPSLSSSAAAVKLRVIAAGAWHNLVLCFLIWLSYYANLERAWSMVGWKNMSDSGVIVLGVESVSRLSVITDRVPG